MKTKPRYFIVGPERYGDPEYWEICIADGECGTGDSIDDIYNNGWYDVPYRFDSLEDAWKFLKKKGIKKPIVYASYRSKPWHMMEKAELIDWLMDNIELTGSATSIGFIMAALKLLSAKQLVKLVIEADKVHAASTLYTKD
jgi:hypothetical protein